MFPVLTIDDHGNQTNANVKHFRHILLCPPLTDKTANPDNILVRQLVAWVLFAVGARTPPSFFSISDIVTLRPDKQVFRIYARWIVATMPNHCPMKSLPLWDWAVVQFVGDTVSKHLSVFNVQGAVTSFVFICCPQPTTC